MGWLWSQSKGPHSAVAGILSYLLLNMSTTWHQLARDLEKRLKSVHHIIWYAISCKEPPLRFVYKVVLMVDGNFKANHVWQQSDGDVWLLDGGGITLNRQEYFTFLASAIERFTVRISLHQCRCRCQCRHLTKCTESSMRKHIPCYPECLTLIQSL